ncbi:DNA-3-methyladenine glycosylase I [Corynebacterium pacaense]|uniref:DNA-3-methyladenine glycosylase I n=1 Tax=Corynebacterium pacaense TaxID=1816684 RepID=UPI0009B98436|nr:DNA-3-methyladenine glycosylase I [Corynebacterium pacaense]
MTTITTHTSNDPVRCADGRTRPRWASRGELSWIYFDEEWGRAPDSDSGLLEILSMIVFQLGITWQAVLAKRNTLRSAFAGFDPAAVARFGPEEVEFLLADPGVFRNRRKIEAVINNAKAMLRLPEPVPVLLERYAGHHVHRPGDPVPLRTDGSSEAAAALKEAGFSHIGPTGAFILMQATGVVNGRAYMM